jgi:hypothetical protein
MFGFFSFITNMAPFMMDAAPWEVSYAEWYVPVGKPHAITVSSPQPIPVMS